MSASNTPSGYGWVARSFHWIIAVLILTALGLGLWADSLREDTTGNLQAVFQAFSLHKTVGIAALFFALARILWMLSQTKPRALHPERRLENWLAEIVHWGLYTGMVIMPLSGWLVHSAAPGGFARILWPFGQHLPFVPQDVVLSERFATFHSIGWWVLGGFIALHVAGAIKHAVIDRDATLTRMLRDIPESDASAAAVAPATPRKRSHLPQCLIALAVWAGIAIAAMSLPPQPDALIQATSSVTEPTAANTVADAQTSTPTTTPTTSPATATSATASTAPLWQVESGSLGISVKQAGAAVEGQFGQWSATIHYDPETRTGEVTVLIDTGSLTLGAVSDTAKGPDFLNASQFPQARFQARIDAPENDGAPHLAKGDLTIAGKTAITQLPFELTITGDEAKARGEMTVDRRDFEVGKSYADEGTVGFPVVIDFDLTAKRQ